ncbi:hypothetical protein RW115_11955 [Macrococcus capreoli]
MKDFWIDLKQKIKNNRTIFYWILVLIFLATNISFVCYSKFKGDTLKHPATEINTEIPLGDEKLTLLKSFYNKNEKQIEVVLGFSNVKSVFNEKYLKGQFILQNNLKKNNNVKIKKENPQIISVKLNNIDEDYLLAKLSLSYKNDTTDMAEKADIFIQHKELLNRPLTEKDYDKYAIDFKKSFVKNEIVKMENEIKKSQDKEIQLKNDIESLKENNKLLTEDEKKSLKSTVEGMEKQIVNLREERKKIKEELTSREVQLDEIEALYPK